MKRESYFMKRKEKMTFSAFVPEVQNEISNIHRYLLDSEKMLAFATNSAK